MSHCKVFHLLALAFLLAGVLFSPAATPAASAPAAPAGSPYRFTTEIQISPEATGQDGDRYLPQAAFNSKRGQYLVVWHNRWGGDHRDIYGQRVGVNGQKVGPWFAIATASLDSLQPAVAYNAKRDEYLVVFMRAVYDEGSTTTTHYEIFGQRVRWDGLLLGDAFQIIAWPERSFYAPRLAWDPVWDEYMVVWHAINTKTSLSADVSYRFVLGDGTPDYGNHVSDPGSPINPDIVFDTVTMNFLIVWTRTNTSGKSVVEGKLLTDNGNEVGAGEFGIEGDDYGDKLFPRVAYSNGMWLVVYEDAPSDTPTDRNIRGMWLSADATIKIPAPIATGNTVDSRPVIAGLSNRLEFMVAFQRANENGAQVFMVPLAFAVPVDPLPICDFYGVDCLTPAIAGGPGGYLLAYAEDFIANPLVHTHIYGRTFWQYSDFLPVVLNH